MSHTHSLLSILSDGRFHSGEALGRELGISRAAVWKQLKTLEQTLGLALDAVRGRGYRLAGGCELLDGERIRAGLAPAVQTQLDGLQIHFSLDSTNRHLMQHASALPGQIHACLAERQTAGRGRHGRPWISPFGQNIYLSLLWRAPVGPEMLGGVSLLVGAALVQALERLGAEGIGLKWPNDLLWRGRKLAGVLLELAGETAGPCQLVTGVGLNMRMDKAAAADIDQPWVDLATVMGKPMSRNRVVSAVLDTLVPALLAFPHTGLAPHLLTWRRFDLLQGRAVHLSLPDRTVVGTARGVDETGALLLDGEDGRKRYFSGEVSVRLASGEVA